MRTNLARNTLRRLAGFACAVGMAWAVFGAARSARSAQPEKVVVTMAGVVMPGQLVQICPKVSGQVSGLFVEPGTTVKTGDLVAALDATTFRWEVERQQAKVAAAKGRCQELKSLLQDDPKGTGAARLAIAEAELKMAEVDLRTAEFALANTQVRAPLDGTILNRQADVGMVIDPDHSTVLYEMADLRNLMVAVDLAESTRDYLAEGQVCRITRPGSKVVCKGKILRIFPAADPNTATFPARVKIEDKAETLRPGMMVNVEFLGRD
jgi:RND family efflux transporter MFP subunit